MVYQQGGVGIVQHSLSIESGRDCSTWPSYRVSYGLFIMVSLQGGPEIGQYSLLTGWCRDCSARPHYRVW